ncbi:unnamed protein product [Moneuplotes crassus]|uniref:Uncharacterized protein n=1 Tax=Euplotes crassus TaxID=5936 RepID=A0AAD1XWT3_EUPCR|nr:unnamed protein product [Moneuplotes crassus]
METFMLFPCFSFMNGTIKSLTVSKVCLGVFKTGCAETCFSYFPWIPFFCSSFCSVALDFLHLRMAPSLEVLAVFCSSLVEVSLSEVEDCDVFNGLVGSLPNKSSSSLPIFWPLVLTILLKLEIEQFSFPSLGISSVICLNFGVKVAIFG